MARDMRLEKQIRALPDLEVVGGLLEGRYYRQDQGEIPSLLERAFVKAPSAIARPLRSEGIERLAGLCAAQGVPLVPRGAASYPLGGTLPVKGGVVLDLSLHRQVLSVDERALTATVAAGTRWDDLDRHLAGCGLATLAYPTSRFSTIAGWVATGGYGVGSVRYGHFSHQVSALDVVTPGSAARRVLPGDTLFEAMFGTEGQLGIVSTVTVKIRPRPERTHPILLYADGAARAIESGRTLLGEGLDPFHLLYMDAERLAIQNRLLGADHFPRRHALLATVESPQARERLASWAAGQRGLGVAPLYHATLLWHDRFFPLKAKSLGPGLLAAELVMPATRAAAFFEEAHRTAAAFGVHTDAEAYFIDGDKVLAITPFLTDPDDTARYYVQLGLVALLTGKGVAMGGRPYGLGFWNQGFAGEVFGDRLASLRDLKRRVDPAGVLNPGKSLAGPRADLAYLALGPASKLGMGLFEATMPWLQRLLPQPRPRGATAGVNASPTAIAAWHPKATEPSTAVATRSAPGAQPPTAALTSEGGHAGTGTLTGTKAGRGTGDGTRNSLDRSPESSRVGAALSGTPHAASAPTQWLAAEGSSPLAHVLARSRSACSRCGACVTVCPAYLTTRDEMVTARGKLFAATQLAAGRLPSDEAQRMFLCMHCQACQEVCQSQLPLMECWDRLEEYVDRAYGRPVARIEAFVQDVERQPDYQTWIDQNVRARANLVRLSPVTATTSPGTGATTAPHAAAVGMATATGRAMGAAAGSPPVIAGIDAGIGASMGSGAASATRDGPRAGTGQTAGGPRTGNGGTGEAAGGGGADPGAGGAWR